MLVSKDNKDKEQSTYSCDRCSAPLNYKNKVAIYVGLPSRSPKKKYDLCSHCYNVFKKNVQKGIVKKES